MLSYFSNQNLIYYLLIQKKIAKQYEGIWDKDKCDENKIYEN